MQEVTTLRKVLLHGPGKLGLLVKGGRRLLPVSRPALLPKQPCTAQPGSPDQGLTLPLFVRFPISTPREHLSCPSQPSVPGSPPAHAPALLHRCPGSISGATSPLALLVPTDFHSVKVLLSGSVSCP